MQNKSEMINRIAELAEENAKLNAIIDSYQPILQALKDEIKYLEEEKKEKIQLLEQIINILYPNANDDELFTITFNSEYIDKLKKLQQTLQEIKEICKNSHTSASEDYYRTADKILQKITKAEEE